MQSSSPNKASTSFHSIALNFIYIGILITIHFFFAYIDERVYLFFNVFFLILSIIFYFYFNVLLRTSSITHFSYSSLFFRIVLSAILLGLSIIFVAFISNTTEIIKRDVFVIFILNIILLSLLIMVTTKYLYSLIRPKANSNVILITDSDEIKNLRIKNLFSNDLVNVKQFNINEIDSMIDHAVTNQVETVYIYVGSKKLNDLESILNNLSIYAFSLFWVLPESFFKESSYIQYLEPVLLNGSPVNLDTNQYLLKRSIDVIGSTALLLLSAPFLIITSIAIKLTDGGTIFFRQKRYGQNGLVFNMLKFRSMKADSHDPDTQVSNDDDRVTSIGKIIRKTSVDELPQLVNILRGEMSLVGPRPQTEDEIAVYSKKLIKFLTRHHVKPGLTGLAQIRTRVKTDSTDLMNEKLLSDLEYIKNWSLYLDLKILINTPISMWANKNDNT